MNEAETRAEYIDPALAAAGWGVVEGSRIRREYPITLGRLEGFGQRGKALLADYVLIYRNTKLGVVEAKAWDEKLTEGVAQAKNYANKLAVRFTYSTNGQSIYGIDMRKGLEGEVPRFPTPHELWNLTFPSTTALRTGSGIADAWHDRFTAVPFENRGGYFQSRYYQDIAVERVLEAIASGLDRVLLTLATGTGKTFIAFQIAWKLFHSRWNLPDWKANHEPFRRPRILFLADRNILANQAFNDFSAFPEDALVRIAPDDIRKKGRVPKNGSIFFTIFQTFMSGPPKDGQPSPYFGEYPPDFFDFIIIDECHRGGANDESTWRDILEYFAPAVQLGLTATPKRRDNADTYAYFGEPVFIYSLKDGINDGFLTPFKVRQFSTTLDGYVHTPDDTVIEGEIEAGRRYDEKDFNRNIEIMQREQYRVRLFMNMIDQREKTVVFCATQEHALIVRDLINQMKDSKDPDYCHRVTADDGKLGEQHLRDFQDNEKTIPTILTTSQKLSTGVNARNIRNIVLMRPIDSMIEFKQIIGRGTRLYDGKYYFTIHDFVAAHHHFSDPEWDGEPLESENCPKCGKYPCVCEKPEPKACPKCGQRPCVCPCPDCGKLPCECGKKTKVKVKLADGKDRTIQHTMVTSFWHPDGTPMSAQQFMEQLFGKLPGFFKDEAELRAIWSAPDTRARLLDGLAEKGFGAEQMTEMQRIIDAEKSDLFDVLAYVAYALSPLTREERARMARTQVEAHFFDSRQRAFLDFVLAQYVDEGVRELDPGNLKPLLRLRYHDSIADAVDNLGQPGEISAFFTGFQQFLYQPYAAPYLGEHQSWQT
ncbi:MAG: DEAD/DEAH box helicase family protein [Gammaproteobacteria bacterium]|nr:DEAD/DEAH box helicase family protein [Gammaproteobacteria bacterium]